MSKLIGTQPREGQKKRSLNRAEQYYISKKERGRRNDVRAATGYTTQGSVELFISRCCRDDPASLITARVLYAIYLYWGSTVGLRRLPPNTELPVEPVYWRHEYAWRIVPASATTFRDIIRTRGYQEHRGGAHVLSYWSGLALQEGPDVWMERLAAISSRAGELPFEPMCTREEARQARKSRYMESDDAYMPFLRFIQDICITESGARAYRHMLYALYKQWCEENGILDVLESAVFSYRMTQRYPARIDGNGFRYWAGVRPSLAPNMSAADALCLYASMGIQPPPSKRKYVPITQHPRDMNVRMGKQESNSQENEEEYTEPPVGALTYDPGDQLDS